MVEGVEVKVPSFFWPITCFFMFLASLNPLVILECQDEEYCTKIYVSQYDGENYTNWRGNGTWLQATGNLTIDRLTHGWVDCSVKCEDCDEDECASWNYTGMRELDNALQTYGKALPTFLTSMCICEDYCEDSCVNGRIALPGDYTMNSKWTDMDCHAIEDKFDAEEGKICGLVKLYTMVYIIIMCCIAFMVLLLVTMLGLEYVNFDSFLDGRCRCLFCPFWVKKLLYISMALVCLAMQIYTYCIVRSNTKAKLDDYFEVIQGDFAYSWNTKGLYLFITAIAGSSVTILTMFMMPKVERQKKKSYKNDIHGISTESILSRKF